MSAIPRLDALDAVSRGGQAVVDLGQVLPFDPNQPLSVSLLDIPTAKEAGAMEEEAAKIEVVGFLKETCESQGFENKKGLQKRIAQILDRSPSLVSRALRDVT